MAKTYTLTSTSINGGSTASQGNHWAAYYATDANGRMIGYSSSFYRAVNILFSSSDLAQFSGKTITKIELKITTTGSGYLPSTAYAYRVRFKANSTATGTASANAWACTSDDTDLATLSASSRTSVASGTVYTLSVGTTLPTYGYVISVTNQGNAYLTLTSSAQLLVTTNETDKTYKLTYNNNGGSGTPATQSATTTASSYTFTVNPSSTAVTKTGYTFLGWSTSSSATSASYSNGSSITISANTTLYAVWHPYKVTIRYNANGGSMASTHGSDYAINGSGLITKNGSTDFHTVNYGSSTDPYNYNNSSSVNLTKTGYAAVSGSEWNTKADGTGTSFNQATSYAATTYASNVSTGNRTITLYVNWKATTSTISASNGTLGTQMAISITRYNTSYKHTITAKYGTQTATVGTNIDTSVNWTPPIAWASEYPNASSATCTLTCETFNGSISLGTTTKNITLSIPSSVKCTVSSVALAETVANVASQFSAFVQTKSKIRVTGTTSTSGAYGGTVKSYAITINGQTLTSNGATTNAITSSGTLSYSFKITDSRGFTDTYTGTYNVLAYSAPSVTMSAQRNSSTPTTVDVNYTYAIASVNSLNTKQIQVQYRENGTSAWTTATTVTPTSYSGSGTYSLTNIDIDLAHDVQVVVADYFTSASASSSVSALGNRIFGISHVDQTIARHGDSPADGKDHQYFPEEFHENVMFDNPASFGTTSSFTGDATFSSSILTSYGDLAQTGNVLKNEPSSVSVPTATWKTVASITFTEGIWLVTGTVRYASNATGYRWAKIGNTSDDNGQWGIASNDAQNAVNGDYTFCRATFILEATSSETYYLKAYQNSGSSLTTYGRMYAVRIA